MRARNCKNTAKRAKTPPSGKDVLTSQFSILNSFRAGAARLGKRAGDTLAIRSGWARRRFASRPDKVRVLAYHGLIPDELGDRPWVPSHFVTVSQFDRQMAALAGLATVPRLGEVVGRMRLGRPIEGPTICVTFDDGTADNLTLALPVLGKHRHRATFFLATGHVDRGEPLPNDVIRLLSGLYRAGRLDGPVSPRCRELLTRPGFNKSRSLLSYRTELYELWARNRDSVEPLALQSLQMMTWDDVRALRDAGMEIGAHTVNHVILTREDRATRLREITDSVARVRVELGQQEVPFAYPNGQAEDYDHGDVQVLESLNVPWAATGMPGCNDPATPHLELRRNCIGRHCTGQAFLAQVFDNRRRVSYNPR